MKSLQTLINIVATRGFPAHSLGGPDGDLGGVAEIYPESKHIGKDRYKYRLHPRVNPNSGIKGSHPNLNPNLHPHPAGGSKLYELYTAIRTGAVKTDSEARALLYPERRDVPIATYHSVKTRLYDKLIEAISAYGTSGWSGTGEHAQHITDTRRMHAIRYLMMIEEYEAAADIAARVMKSARKHGWTAMIIECYEVFCFRNSLNGNDAELRESILECEYWRNVRCAEERATDAVYRFSKMSLWEVPSAQEVSLLLTTIDDVSKSIHLYGTHRLVEAWFTLRRALHRGKQEYDESLALAHEQDLYYRRMPNVRSQQNLVRSRLDVMMVYLWRGEQERAEHELTECKNVVTTGSPLWYELQERALFIAIRTKKVDEAEEILRSLRPHSENNEHALKACKVFDVYVRFLRRVRASSSEDKDGTCACESGVPYAGSVLESTMHRSERGFNVVCVIAKVLDDLMDDKYEQVAIRDESLQAMRRKRLRHMSKRLDVFMRLLHVLVESDFDGVRAQRRGARLFSELRIQRMMHDRGEYDMLEVLCFDDIWEGVIQLIKERREENRAVI